jgi:hypothetical protein
MFKERSRRGRNRMLVGFTTTCANQRWSPLKLWVRIPLIFCSTIQQCIMTSLCQAFSYGRRTNKRRRNIWIRNCLLFSGAHEFIIGFSGYNVARCLFLRQPFFCLFVSFRLSIGLSVFRNTASVYYISYHQTLPKDCQQS